MFVQIYVFRILPSGNGGGAGIEYAFRAQSNDQSIEFPYDVNRFSINSTTRDDAYH